ncbi:hypothetical protein RLIN73S_03162 [Rhodanobacter lindaniclasticus]
MILQALDTYYRRKQADPDPTKRLPAEGLEDKEIEFIAVIEFNGTLFDLIDTRHVEGKKKIGQRFLVPQGIKKTSGVAANLLWDDAVPFLAYRTGRSWRTARRRTRQASTGRACWRCARHSARELLRCPEPRKRMLGCKRCWPSSMV